LAAAEAIPEGAQALVVTHGGPIRALCARLLGTEVDALARVANASLTVVVLTDRPRLIAYNQTVR